MFSTSSWKRYKPKGQGEKKEKVKTFPVMEEFESAAELCDVFHT